MKKVIITLALALPLFFAGINAQAQNDPDVLSNISKAREASDQLHSKKAQMEENWKNTKEGYKNVDSKTSATDKTDAKSAWKDKKSEMKSDYEAKKAEYKKQQDQKKAESEAQKTKAKADLDAIKNTWKK